MKTRILIVTFFLACLNTNAQQPVDSVSILFIGSSYFNFNNLPDIVRGLANTKGKEVFIDSSVRNGWSLHDHSINSGTEELIRSREWDYVVLQGSGGSTAYPDYFVAEPTLPALELLEEKILDNYDSTKIIFSMPWAYEDGMTWLEGWYDTFEDMQMQIYVNSLSYSNNLDMMIAPVGWAWLTVLKEKDYPLHYLHDTDWNHPSISGSYLSACVIFSTIFQESSYGIPYNNGLVEQEARYFQTIASRTVMHSRNLWNIPVSILVAEDVERKNPLQDISLFPNPSRGPITISMNNNLIGEIYIKVLSNDGRLIYEEILIKSEYKLEKHVNLDQQRPGNYMFYIKSGKTISCQKIILF